MAGKKPRGGKPEPKTPEQMLIQALLGQVLMSTLGSSWKRDEGEAFIYHCVESVARARLYADSYEERRHDRYMNQWALFGQVSSARAEAVGLLIYLQVEVGPDFANGIWSLASTTRKIGRREALRELVPPSEWKPQREPTQAELDAARAMFSEPL